MAVCGHWQDNAKNLVERVSLMWKNHLFTDHVIKVKACDDYKDFKVNKIFLAIASPYFESLFYGSFESHCDSTEIKDIDPRIFGEFLRYIYTDKLEIKSFDDGRNMYTVADRFLMPELQKLCLNVIRKDTNLLNICQAYEFYKLYNIKEAMKSCEEGIISNTITVIESPRFVDIEKETLLWILKQNDLAIESEIEIYNAAIKWIKAEEERVGECASNEHSGEWWSEIIRNVRFSCMTPEEFSCGPVLDPYISKEDKLAFLTKLSCAWAPVEYPKDYCTNMRTRLIMKCNLAQDKIEASNESDYSDTEDEESPPLRHRVQPATANRLPSNWRKVLYDAVNNGDAARLSILYQQGADINTRYGKNRRTLLHVAASAGRIESVRWLAARRVDVDAKNYWGWTALHLASRAGHAQVVRFLLSCGAESTVTTNNNKTVYDVACDHIKDVLDQEYSHVYFPVSQPR